MRLGPLLAVLALGIGTSAHARSRVEVAPPVESAPPPQWLVAGEPPAATTPSPVAEHTARVMDAFLRFAAPPTPVDYEAPGDAMRERDRLLLLRDPRTASGDPNGVSVGAALFSATVFVAAHAPPSLRSLLLDAPIHLGPAAFDSGGLGAGIGGRWR